MKKKMIISALVLLILGATFCGVMYFRTHLRTREEDKAIDDLYGEVFHTAAETEAAASDDTAPPQTQTPEPDKEEAARQDGYDYDALLKTNADCIGWITIPETEFSRPVMWRENDNAYYLYRDVYGNNSRHGTPFIDGFCDPSQGNLVLYGHNLMDRGGFGALMNYTSLSFYTAHPSIDFYIQREKHVFDIFAVCKISAQYDKEFYEYYGLHDEESLQAFLDKAMAKSLYSTGVEPNTEDRIILLSTCEYSQANGRLVILAREAE